VAQRSNLRQAYLEALAGDPVSAFGGVLISNSEIDVDTAEEIHKLFCEVVIAPSFSPEALTGSQRKKEQDFNGSKINRITRQFSAELFKWLFGSGQG
jgi:phosphoribosylaminoimidazolecarboxamide formyltransferase/IMP cyclohydrolase